MFICIPLYMSAWEIEAECATEWVLSEWASESARAHEWPLKSAVANNDMRLSKWVSSVLATSAPPQWPYRFEYSFTLLQMSIILTAWLSKVTFIALLGIVVIIRIFEILLFKILLSKFWLQSSNFKIPNPKFWNAGIRKTKMLLFWILKL